MIDLSNPNPLLEAIPEPGAIRERLAKAVREVALLRQLLKVAERKAKDAIAFREVANVQ